MKSPLDSPKWPNRWTPSPTSGSSEHKLDDHYHAHGSDDENDGGDHSATSMDDLWEPQRQRSRSYSDAEDIMNGVYNSPAATTPASTSPPASNNGGKGVGRIGGSNTASGSYYDSYPYSSPSQQNGLHHRSTASSRTDRIRDHDNNYHHSSSLPHSPPRVYTRSNSHRSLLRRPNSNNNSAFHKGRRLGGGGIGPNSSTFSSRQFVKCCLVAGFGAYVLILIRGSVLLLKNESNEVSSGVGNPYAAMLLPMGRDAWNQQQSISIREADIRMTQRAEQRRKRIQLDVASQSLKSSSSSYETRDMSWYDVTLMDQREHAHQELESSTSEVETATVDNLCGWHARNASQVEPQLYPASTALNSNSRVLITGILNPIGFHLALHLKEHCGVQVIAGMDSMYPNTVEHRLELQERIEILTTNIPKLSKPLLLPYVGMDSRQKKQHQQTPGVILDSTGEFNVVSLKPTHIVHLASYSLTEAMESGAAYTKSIWKNTQSPYVSDDYDPPLYQIQNSMISMEQILMGLADTHDEDEELRPHLLFSSSPIQRQGPSITGTNVPQNTAKLVDEVMADTYHSSSDVYSVGVRLPNIVYGPWSRKGSIVDNLIEETIQNWDAVNEASFNLTIPDNKETNLDMVYVDDVVDSLVAAMQIRSPRPVLMDVSSGVENTLLSTVSAIKSFLPNLSDSKGKRKKQKQRQLALAKQPITQMLLQQQQRDGLLSSNGDSAKTGSRRFQWITPTSLQQGLLKTIAWHLDRSAPFGGPNSIESGDELLMRHEAPTCSADDLLCHRGRDYVPCLSECNIKDQCLPSIFDDVQELLQTVTEGCDVILYTHTLGHNVKDLKLHAEYMDESTLKKNDELICNFAFVPRDSDVVKTVAGRVPMEKLAKFGIKPKASDTANSIREQTLEGLNGRLLYRGWILIWVPDALEDLSYTDRSLLKLSPGKLFHKDVKRALFVEENFSVSPNIEDVQFLVAEMKRDAFSKRTVKKDVTETNPISGKDKTKQVKYRLPAEPPRRASILFAPLRFPNKHIEGHNPDKKLSIHAATKFMRYELDLDPNEKEPVEIRRQREFYERIPSYLNRNELRSFSEPWYRYSMRHWVRTRWVVHDLELEESRLLRCEWYQEHIQWESDVDQLSFAHVMAKRELERRMAHHEPDDHFKTFVEEHPELHDLTDSYEWHAMESARNRDLLQNRLYREPSGNWLAKLPDHVHKDADDLDEKNSEKLNDDQVPLFVRIMSEKMMAVSRKSWSRHKKKKK